MTSSPVANGPHGLPELQPSGQEADLSSPPMPAVNGGDQPLPQPDLAEAPDSVNQTEQAEPPLAKPSPEVSTKLELKSEPEPPQESTAVDSQGHDTTLIKCEPLDQTEDLNMRNFYAPPSMGLFSNGGGIMPDAIALMQLARGNMTVDNTVTPAQTSLRATQAMLAENENFHTGPHAPKNTGLESFARIEFADSVFQMTTYAVIIGRDQRAVMQARQDEKRRQDYERKVEEHLAKGLPPPSPPSQNQGKFSKSYISEEGGMLGPESDGGDEGVRPAKRRRTSATGAAVHIHHNGEQTAHDRGLSDTKNRNPVLNRQYVSHTPGAALVDLAAVRPSLDYVPFIPIHSPGPDILSNTKAISREHLKIKFNQEKCVFEAIVLHKNGFFLNEEHIDHGTHVLKSGARLQIKDIQFNFIISGVPKGKTGAEDYENEEDEAEEESSSKRYSEGGKEMSFEFESSHPDEMRSTSEEEEEVMDLDESENEASEDGIEEGEAGDEDEEDVLETVESDEQEEETEPKAKADKKTSSQPPRKRGPGRPPKNGIMSKREERLLKKQQQEEARKNMPQAAEGEAPVKRKVGRPRKHPLPENAGDKPEKRKYKPRKPKNPDGGSDAEKVVKEKRREKPKTPPLELKVEDFTPDQLEKPNKNYGVLIDEVLRDAPQGLSLKQIYKRIQQKYPYYYFNVETKGWESSVRHNLIGNDAFKKNDETHLWSRVPGVELDAGKKRKAASPDRTPSHALGSQWTPQAPHPQYHGQHGITGSQQFRPGTLPPQGYANTANQTYNGLPAQPQYAARTAGLGTANHAPPQAAYSVQSQTTTASHLSGYGTPAGGRHLQPNVSTASYSSPYGSRPIGPSPSVANAGQAGMAAQRPAQPPVTIPRPQAVNTTQASAPASQVSGTSALGVARPSMHMPPATGTASLPLKPAVDPTTFTAIKSFKDQVVSQVEKLAKRAGQAEAIAMSVINRGVGLATKCTVPEHEAVENIIFSVFVNWKERQSRLLEPRLVEILMGFKAEWMDTLKPKVGEQKAESLLLSAIDQALGFTEKSILQPADDTEKVDFEEAERLLVPLVRTRINNYQHSISGTS